MSDYKPKTGDRVKVTLEGTVGITYDAGGFFVGDYSYVSRKDRGLTYSIEKLPDPEPVWAYGAAVRVKDDPATFTYNGEGWYVGGFTVDWSGVVSNAWNDGTLRVLWNGEDAE